MHAISSYHVNRPTNTHTNPPTYTQTGLITIHCTAASVQCNKKSWEHIEKLLLQYAIKYFVQKLSCTFLYHVPHYLNHILTILIANGLLNVNLVTENVIFILWHIKLTGLLCRNKNGDALRYYIYYSSCPCWHSHIHRSLSLSLSLSLSPF